MIKLLRVFSAKNITAVKFVGTVKLNESSTNDFIELTMLWKTGSRKINTLKFWNLGIIKFCFAYSIDHDQIQYFCRTSLI